MTTSTTTPIEGGARPGVGILAEHVRRAALTAHQQEAGEMHSVEAPHHTSQTSEPIGGTGDWRARAACRSVPPETFFPTAVSGPELARAEATAKRVCAGCPVRAACLAWALAELPHGVAGGLSESERATQRRTGRREASAGRKAGGLAGRAHRASRNRDAGWAALAAGLGRDRVATECGVTRRTVDRWATTLRQDGGA